MDERTAPSAAFALRLVSDLLTVLINSGTISPELGTITIDSALAELLESQPEYEQSFRSIAATLTTQVALSRVDLEALKRRDQE